MKFMSPLSFNIRHSSFDIRYSFKKYISAILIMANYGAATQSGDNITMLNDKTFQARIF